MMNYRRYALGLLTLGLCAPTLMADDLQIPWHTVDGGGGRSAGGAFVLIGTIGQSDASTTPMTGGTFSVTGGFLAGPPVGPPVPGDCNMDGVVNWLDFVDLEPCLGGPAIAPTPNCDCFDLEADSDVDLVDLATFQQGFTGS